MSKPNILISSPSGKVGPAFACAYTSVFFYGGIPKRTTPKNWKSITDYDGLILSGGADIHPAFYVQDDKESPEDLSAASIERRALCLRARFEERKGIFAARSSSWDVQRDIFEFSLLAQSLAKGTPLLGICRGLQLLNVFLGGTLRSVENGEGAHPSSLIYSVKIEVERQSMLYGISGADTMAVNSIHTDEIQTLGDHLKTVGRNVNGNIRAVEFDLDPENRFLLGVQWHPEFGPYRKNQRLVFDKFLEASRTFRNSHS